MGGLDFQIPKVGQGVVGSPANTTVNNHPTLGVLGGEPSGRPGPNAVVTLSRRLGVVDGRIHHMRFSSNNLSRGLDGGHPYPSVPEVRVRQTPAGLDFGSGTNVGRRRHICPVGFPSSLEPGVAQSPVAPDSPRPQVGAVAVAQAHHGVQALVAAVPEGHPRQEMGGASAVGGRQPRRSKISGAAFPHLRSGLWHAHRLRGAWKEEAQVLIAHLNTATLSRYHSGFKALVRLGVQTGVIPALLEPSVFLAPRILTVQ